ncbi:MAG: MarR family transcriptional regulator [Eubacteriales bacterium]|nr:MarR family transcriptional regulator [Eubacteriales bacterium]
MTEDKMTGCALEGMDMIPGNTLDSWVIRLIHAYGARNHKRFRGFGLHPGQIPVFGLLSDREGLSLREIADILHIKPPTVTVSVKRLEKSGFICKRADEKDQRISRIYMTEAGKNLQQEIRQAVEENERILTNGFSVEEQEQLKQFLGRMTENLIHARQMETGGDYE